MPASDAYQTRLAASAKGKSAGSAGLNYIVDVVTCRQRCLFPFQLSTTSTTVASSLYDNMYIESQNQIYSTSTTVAFCLYNNMYIHIYAVLFTQY